MRKATCAGRAPDIHCISGHRHWQRSDEQLLLCLAIVYVWATLQAEVVASFSSFKHSPSVRAQMSQQECTVPFQGRSSRRRRYRRRSSFWRLDVGVVVRLVSGLRACGSFEEAALSKMICGGSAKLKLRSRVRTTPIPRTITYRDQDA